MTKITLFDYWRSSASYRVRIALNLKSIDYMSVSTNLADGQHKSMEYRARNPQGFVPLLEVDGVRFTQSLAIIDFLDSHVEVPRMIPSNPVGRAHILALAQIIIADIHPLNNLRVLKYLKDEMLQSQEAIDRWYRHWISDGFAALEAHAPETGFFGGDHANLVDICLVPQMYNARRFDTLLDDFPKLVQIDAELCAIEAIAHASPEAVTPI